MKLFPKWKPKTIAGKLIKYGTIGIGAAATVASGIGAVAGLVGGGGVLAGAIAGGGALIRGAKTVTSKVAGASINLVSGFSKENREVIKDVKEEAKKAQEQMKLVQKLINLGKSKEEAYNIAGVQIKEIQEKIEDGGFLGFLGKNRKEKKEEEKEKEAVKAGINPLLVGALVLFGLPMLFKNR